MSLRRSLARLHSLVLFRSDPWKGRREGSIYSGAVETITPNSRRVRLGETQVNNRLGAESIETRWVYATRTSARTAALRWVKRLGLTLEKESTDGE